MSFNSTLCNSVRGSDITDAVCGRILALRNQLHRVDATLEDRGEIVELIAEWRARLILLPRADPAAPSEAGTFTECPIDDGGEA